MNLSPTSDATITPTILSVNVDLQLQGEYRYLDKNFSGVSSAEILNNDNTRRSVHDTLLSKNKPPTQIS